VLITSLLLITGCSEEQSSTVPPPRPVQFIEIQSADMPAQFEFSGRTASSRLVEIRARVSGFLDDIVYREGSMVQQDDVLFRIDPQPFQARLNGALALQAQQQARLDNAQSLLNRVIPLAEARAVAQKELDDARALVAEASAALEGADAQVFEAELNLGYATIRSPVTGIAGAAALRQGALIGSSSESLTQVAQIDPLWVEFSVAENQLLQSARRQRGGEIRFPEDDRFEVEVVLGDGTVHPETGRISFADAAISDRTGTLLFRAEIPNPEGSLRPGQFVRAILKGAVRPQAIVVPQRAVQQGPQGAFVWLANDNDEAEIRPVLTAAWINNEWLIREGLFPGDRVIVDGLVGLRANAAIAPRPYAEAAQADANNSGGQDQS